MSNSAASGAHGAAEQVRNNVFEAFERIGFDRDVIESALLSSEDIASLIDAVGDPAKILQAGGDIGVSTLTLALAFPNARIVRIDPNLPVAGGSAEDIARRAAQAAGVEQHIEFVTGGFSESVTRRSVIDSDLGGVRTQARMAGPEACAREQPFDLAFIDGLTSVDARASDIRLAASALAPDGVIVSTHSVGPSGATVRSGIFEFLRYFPGYTFAHDDLGDARRTLGFLMRREAGWAGGRTPASARELREAGVEVRDRLADLVALTVGARPILEVAVGEPVLGAAYRSRGLASRTLRLTGTDWNTHFFDPVIDQICNALDHTKDSVLFSSDLMDFAPDEFVGRLFARLEDRRSQALFFATPPGEAHSAGPRSRPAARIIDLAASQNVRAFAPAALEFERARHEGAHRQGWLGGASRYASFLMFSRDDAGRDARGRNIPEVSPQTVQLREQVELQRIWAEAALHRSLDRATIRQASAERERDSALQQWREASQAIDEERARSERSLSTLQNDLQRAQAEATHLAQEKQQADTRARSADDRYRASERTREETEASLRAELDRLRAEVIELQRSRDAVAADLQAMAAKASEAGQSGERRIRELETELERWRSEREALVLEKEEAEAARRKAGSEREAAEAALADRLRQSESALEALRAESERQVGDLERRLRTAEQSAAEPDALADLRKQLEVALEDNRGLTEALSELKAELSAESLQVVDAQCREVDTQVSLEGIANHLAVTHDALRRFRASPASFAAREVPYPYRTEIFEGKDENLVARASELHGRSADLSREVAKELERLSAELGEYEAWKTRRLEISETAHEEALRMAKAEFSSQFWAQERLNARVAAGVAFNNRLLADILALTPGLVEDPAQLSAEVAELELTANAAVSLDALEQITAQEKRLLHLLHTLEAEQAMDEADFVIGEEEFAAEWGEPEAETPTDVEELIEGDAPEEGKGFTASMFSAERVVRPSEFGAGSESAPRSEGNVVRDYETDEPTVVDFVRPERIEGDEDWSNGDAPTWRVARQRPASSRSTMFWSRIVDRFRTYPETARLVRLQRSLRDQLVKCPVNPRVFDVDLYRAQGSTDPYIEPLHHYLIEGEAAGWSPLAGFDPAYYATQVGDLGGWKGSLLRHFLSRGVHDRRSPSKLLEGLSDRAVAAGMDPLEYFFHWENAARGTWRESDDLSA